MSNLVFDFADTARVIQELPPEEQQVMSMNGWPFAAKPKIPYQRKFKVNLFGMKWYLNTGQTALDETTDTKFNAGRLLTFYRQHRLWDSFLITHQYLGSIRVRFAAPVTIPAGIPQASGLIEDFEVNLIEHNPSYT
jgi:hypothetical protein